jgi:hypothetical protein
MQSAQYIDKATIAENARKAVKQQEMDLFKYYSERAK